MDVYDLDGSRAATLISRSATLVDKPGRVSFDLYGDDWKLLAGHRLGVLITGANAEWWAHAPTMQTVTVRSATIDLPFLACRRSASIEGDPAIRLEDYRASAPFTVDAATIAGATSPQLAVPALQDFN